MSDKSKNKLNLAGALESIRIEKGMKSCAFAKLLGLSQPFYSEIENNKKSLSPGALYDICVKIKIPLDVLIFKAVNEPVGCNYPRKNIHEISSFMDEMRTNLYPDLLRSFKASDVDNNHDSNHIVNIAEALEDIRADTKMNKSKFAELAGLLSSFYSQIIWEKKHLSIANLYSVSINLDISLDVLIFKAVNEPVGCNYSRKNIHEISSFMDNLRLSLYPELMKKKKYKKRKNK